MPYPTIFLLLSLPALALAGTDSAGAIEASSLAEQIRADFRYHYSARPLTEVAIGFGVSALLANSNADASIQEFFQDDLQGETGDDLAEVFTDVGDLAQPMFSVPIYLAARWLGGRNREVNSATARWGANSLRALLVGTPQLVTLAYVSGGQRPEEGEPGWDPFDDTNGVSGHAFFGAIPIIAAANLTDRRWLRNTLYVSSTLPALARVYEDKHYFSQVFMGWWLAYVSSRTVEHTNSGSGSALQFTPLLFPDGGGLQVRIQF
ncbi:MAG: phosphatase PAP2 family protein [Gammaproteobacteria bacterium]|nr:phosphatase PAP2 family protein [Gammaproteobacteria bacterium]MDH5304750.1 phosphatase PAP2 family protein [Gammaproteobacteria bacterium]MDH5322763.1 phosphatase PAP2 family protein [Gammaproteobacteria bacterium]